MRVKNLILFIFPCIVLWGILTYSLFMTSDTNTGYKSYLETNIKGWSKVDKHCDFPVPGLVHTKTPHIVEVSKESANNVQVNIEGFEGPIISVIVLACDRVTVEKCLNQLLYYRPSKEQFPIIVSQDCNHNATRKVLSYYKDEVTLIHQPDQSKIILKLAEKKIRKGYFKIARHYFWALNQIFFKFRFEAAIIVEDDLDVAPDFFEYFLGTYSILKEDKTLWCVSAWNDNGKAWLIDERSPELLYRTDFFPGLGWMLTKDVWNELAPKWPRTNWDIWMRQPQQRKERACIRPEISRTRTFGKCGISNGVYFEKHLKYIKLNQQYVPFTTLNLTYLLKDNYDRNFVQEVYKSLVVSCRNLLTNNILGLGPVQIQYHSKSDYKRFAVLLGLMRDLYSGIPRMAYRGITSFFYNGRRVHLTPFVNRKREYGSIKI